jgi:uncharacterized repeat protein (TIGR03803 family)
VKNRGAIFAIAVEGGAPRILASFDGSNGAQPWGNLILGGSNLYGLTSVGGAHNKGTVFRFPVGGPKLTTLASFDGSNGADPWGGLTLSPDGSTLYGTTRRGKRGRRPAVKPKAYLPLELREAWVIYPCEAWVYTDTSTVFACAPQREVEREGTCFWGSASF